MTEWWVYEHLTYRTITGIEYTVVRLTDLLKHIDVYIDGYHSIPSPGELTKLATIPNPPIKFSGMIPEFNVTFLAGNQILVPIGNTVYHGHWFPA